MPDVLVHRASRSDLGTIETLLVAFTAELRDQRGGELWSLVDGRFLSDIASELEDSLADPGNLMLLAVFEGQPAGCILANLKTMRDARTVCTVTDLYVCAEFRTIGIGEALLDCCMSWAAEHGASAIDAVALPGARATKNFFESHGFKARALIVSREIAGSESPTP